MDGAGLLIAPHLDAKHPVQFTKVSDLDMAAQSCLEVLNEVCHAGGDGAVVDMHSDNYEVLILGNEFIEDGLVHSRLIKAKGKENQMKLLVPGCTACLRL